MAEHVEHEGWECDDHAPWDTIIRWDDCVLCGERRATGSEYCPQCLPYACEVCGWVHDLGGKCDPPEEVVIVLITFGGLLVVDPDCVVEQ